jgi:hypothetical protein
MSYGRLVGDESLHRLAHDEGLRDMMTRLLAAPVIVHPQKVVRVVWPASIDPDNTTPPHQDCRYVQGAVDTLTSWLVLTPCPVELGGLKVLRGSHRLGLRAARGGDQDRFRCTVIDEALEEGWVTAHYEPGDVVVFHSLTVHAANPNHSNEIRLSADFRYSRLHEPLGSLQVQPPFHPPTPGWDVLCREWPNRGWVDIPDGANVVPYQDPAGQLSPDPSLLLQPEAVDGH